jgi:tRNA nucleotidyltransferase (CCA-adding enzyme)
MSDVLQRILRSLLSLDAIADTPVYLIGGTVRDLLLDADLLRDFDFTVVGDAIEFASDYAKVCAAEVVCHKRFGTATVKRLPGFSDRLWLDFVTARSESYSMPGVLPEVIPGTIEEDMKRRDFTVNALALRVVPELLEVLGETDLPKALQPYVLDLFGGVHDLERGYIKILHENSFLDDPTRIFRAARYAARLGATLESVTESSLKAALAVGALQTISSDRIIRELRLLVNEEVNVEALTFIEFWGVFDTLNLDSPLVFCERFRRDFASAAVQEKSQIWEYAAVISASSKSREALLSLFGFGKKWLRKFERAVERALASEYKEVPESLLYALCITEYEGVDVRSINKYLSK